MGFNSPQSSLLLLLAEAVVDGEVLSPQFQLLLLDEKELDVLRLDKVALSPQSQIQLMLVLLLSDGVEEDVLTLIEYEELTDELVERLDEVLEVVSAKHPKHNVVTIFKRAVILKRSFDEEQSLGSIISGKSVKVYRSNISKWRSNRRLRDLRRINLWVLHRPVLIVLKFAEIPLPLPSS